MSARSESPTTSLLGPGRFDDHEAEDHAKAHGSGRYTIIGECTSPILQQVREIALHHHEKWDGTGYPDRLKGEEIPIECRIVAVADIYDALTHDRPYKAAWPHEDAIDEIRRQSNHHFDPAVVEAFLRVYETQPAT